MPLKISFQELPCFSLSGLPSSQSKFQEGHPQHSHCSPSSLDTLIFKSSVGGGTEHNLKCFHRIKSGANTALFCSSILTCHLAGQGLCVDDTQQPEIFQNVNILTYSNQCCGFQLRGSTVHIVPLITVSTSVPAMAQ